jgi:hypothetical protein
MKKIMFPLLALILALGIGIIATPSYPALGVVPITWTIVKNADQSELTLSIGQQLEVNYTITVDADYIGIPEYDECVDVFDDYAGDLGTVLWDETPKTLTYSRTIGPYDTCGEYTVTNMVYYVTCGSGNSDTSTWTVIVHIPCAGGCTLSPGYWKTHSRYGPAPYDDTWAQINSGVGEDTPFFNSGQSYYEVLWTNPKGNPYYILAHQWIAVTLNNLNGADTSAVTAAMGQADVFFYSVTPGDHFTKVERQQMLEIAEMLDNYNNGYIGPGHCSE